MKKALAIYGAMAVVALAAFAARAKTEQLTSTDRQKVQSFVNKADQAWNSHDASSFAKDFSQDATLLSTDGKLSRGQQQIESTLTELFEGPFENAQNKFTVLSMQRIGPNEILVDLRQQLTGVDMSKLPQPGVGGGGQMGMPEPMPMPQEPGAPQTEQRPQGMQQQSGTMTNHATVLLKQEGNQFKIAAVRAFPEPGTGGAGGAGMNCPSPEARPDQGMHQPMPPSPRSRQQSGQPEQ